MENNTLYDCAIAGGGLSGLCLAIQLADKGWRVVVFEKNTYPMHKVCGEYVSMESYGFLESLGLPLQEWDLPLITELGISAESGFMLEARLALGGFGISRYTLDDALYRLALAKGVTVITACKVQNALPLPGTQLVSIETPKGLFTAKVACGSYGKYTPAFARQQDRKEPDRGRNYIGVKYHIKTDLARHRIELHNFKNGYCGVSKVDKDWYCLCYLSSAESLRQHGNDLATLEDQVLCKNPHLKRYFQDAEFVNRQPLSISNIQFHEKQSYSGHLFLLGDAAGTISPLCGNGMSMGMRASQLLASHIHSYLRGNLTHQALVNGYRQAWREAFHRRIQTGYYLQGLFGKKIATHVALRTLHLLPGLTQKIISMTHGQPF